MQVSLSFAFDGMASPNQDRLDVALRDAERRGEHVGVMFIDLDKFKAINDTLGHSAGTDRMGRPPAQRRSEHRVAVYPDDGDNPVDLIAKADAAMYRVKNAGQ